MCHQNVTESQAQNTHTKSAHCESGLDISMLHRGKSQLPNFSADLLSVPPVWPLFLQQSQLPISSSCWAALHSTSLASLWSGVSAACLLRSVALLCSQILLPKVPLSTAVSCAMQSILLCGEESSLSFTSTVSPTIVYQCYAPLRNTAPVLLCWWPCWQFWCNVWIQIAQVGCIQ